MFQMKQQNLLVQWDWREQSRNWLEEDMGTSITIKMKTSTELLLSMANNLLSTVLMTDITLTVYKHLIGQLNIFRVIKEMDHTNLLI